MAKWAFSEDWGSFVSPWEDPDWQEEIEDEEEMENEDWQELDLSYDPEDAEEWGEIFEVF